jgi:hypothetical protein
VYELSIMLSVLSFLKLGIHACLATAAPNLGTFQAVKEAPIAQSSKGLALFFQIHLKKYSPSCGSDASFVFVAASRH